MSVKLTVDRITPDIKYDDKGNITWTPRLVDYNVAQYPAGHVVTSNEFNTEFLKMVYQGNYLTDTISVLCTLYNGLQSNVKQTAESAASDAATALTKATTAENNSVTAVNTANSALGIVEDAAADAQAAVNAATNAVTTAENAISTAETAKTTAEDASDKADNAYLKAEEAITTAESADSIAVTAQTESTEAKQIAAAANTTANDASTKAANAVSTANIAKQTADTSAATVASKVSQEYVDNKFTDYYNKSTIDTMLDNVTVDLSAYYTSAQVDALIPKTYIKSASVTEDTLNLTKQDNTTITFKGGSTIGIKEKTNTPSAIDPFANYYTKNDVYTKAQTYNTNEVYNKTEINNKLAKAVTIWTGSVTSSGTLTLNSSLNNFRFIEFIGINASDEYYTQIVDVDVLKITTQANPYDFAGNTYDVNRYINLYYTNDTTLTLKNGNNMSLKIIKGII